MADIGIYAIVKILAGLAGITATNPYAETGIGSVPLIEVAADAAPGFELRLTDREGGSLGMLRSGGPVAVDVSQLPEHFINAVVAAEDRRFLEHPGIDPVGTASAAIDTALGRLRGGSGLAQQMVKNTLTGSMSSLDRKATEAMLAVRMTGQLGRQDVLRRYLQSAWFGRGITGVMPAPRAWFGKDWPDVTIAEAATLAAMLRGPGYYDPWRNPERVKPRRDMIISVMEDKEWITPEEALIARSAPVTAVPPARTQETDPWAVGAAADDLAGLPSNVPRRGGARLSIDPEWQSIASSVLSERVRAMSPTKTVTMLEGTTLAVLQAMAEGGTGEDVVLPRDLQLDLPAWSSYRSSLIVGGAPGSWDVLTAWGLEKGVWIEDPHPDWKPAIGALVPALPIYEKDGRKEMEVRLPTVIEAAAVLIDPRDGRLIATIGGVDGNLGAFDRTGALRQPGSAIKPFLYLAALDAGFGPGMSVEDVERSYRSGGQSWRPRNYDRRQMGRIAMYSALERSLNVATVWIANMIGIDAMAEVAEAAGAYAPGQMVRVLPASLGASETTLRQLTAGYATVVNRGAPHAPSTIIRMEGGPGEASLIPAAPPGLQAASAAASADLVAMLRGVAVRGTAYQHFRDHPVAIGGKTGTTQNHRDAWFMGVAPHLAIGIWVGRDDNRPIPGTATGASHAAPIAAEILRRAHEDGLIDAQGYRDESKGVWLEWPPLPHDGSAPASFTAPVAEIAPAPRPAPRGEVRSAVAAPAPDAELMSDPFWGVSRAAPAALPFEAPNRNADLLN